MPARVCVTSYVFGPHKRFVPIFCYTTARAYPEYDVKVFTDGRLDERERELLDAIAVRMDGRVTVEENALKDIAPPSNAQIQGGGPKKLLRWMFTGGDFPGYDYVYFSDIDFVVLRQEPDLAAFHIRNARRYDVPFSNQVRRDKVSGTLSNRLTGLHFVIAGEYFPRVDPVVRAFRSRPDHIAEVIPGIFSDEQFLYHVVREAIPFDPVRQSESPRPLPGLHASWTRSPRRLASLPARAMGRPESRLEEQETRRNLVELLDDPLFLRICGDGRVPELPILCNRLSVRPRSIRDRLWYERVLLRARATLAGQRLARGIGRRLEGSG